MLRERETERETETEREKEKFKITTIQKNARSCFNRYSFLIGSNPETSVKSDPASLSSFVFNTANLRKKMSLVIQALNFLFANKTDIQKDATKKQPTFL